MRICSVISPLRLVVVGFGSLALPLSTHASESSFENQVLPVLNEYCSDCHMDGMDKGTVSFDTHPDDQARLDDRDLWFAVLKNLRAGLMPPEKKPKPSNDDIRRMEQWIKQDVFAEDPDNPDPGHVTLRRLNRVEYQNTIRDLMGIEFLAYEEFPPDDTGYGFDNIGDVLTLSPLLMEKYMQAAETIVDRAVPKVTRMIPERVWRGRRLGATDGEGNGERMDFYKATEVGQSFKLDKGGRYRIEIKASVHGDFNFDPGRCRVTWRLDDQDLFIEEHKWQDGLQIERPFEMDLPAGDYRLSCRLEPLMPESERKTWADYRVANVKVLGPLAPSHWVHPPNYERFFEWDAPPEDPEERRVYARLVLERFASRAYRRPVDEGTVEKLAAFAEGVYSAPDTTFEVGVARAMVAVLASPRFVFRFENTMPPAAPGLHPLVDEFALASRLSYFLWSTMPDEALFDLADRGELRAHLHAQVNRMLAASQSREFIEHFVGQWLQIRDVEGVPINERMVLARDSGQDRELDAKIRRYMELRAIPDDQRTEAQEREYEELRAQRRSFFRGPRVELDGRLRRTMRRETEMLFEHVVRQDRSVLELLDGDYTFLNEILANHYGIPGVQGDEMRRVPLPEDSPRGGVLTHGSVLVVTSNPTRTSPVKRGLFVLDYILGTPPPPPPGDVPLLEESERETDGQLPTLRQTLELHRSQPLCRSCHNRMDPLGLALENFNALGMWRDQERGQDIDSAGQLITGEPFTNIRDHKRILTTDRRADFYRCLTEKLLTYALGRGLEYYDVQTVDSIVARLEASHGRFSELLYGIMDSAPFQKSRMVGGGR